MASKPKDGPGYATVPVGVLAETLDFTIARLEVVSEHMRGNNLYAAGEAFAELRAALKRQRDRLSP